VKQWKKKKWSLLPVTAIAAGLVCLRFTSGKVKSPESKLMMGKNRNLELAPGGGLIDKGYMKSGGTGRREF
jgi:hypothetical protein